MDEGHERDIVSNFRLDVKGLSEDRLDLLKGEKMGYLALKEWVEEDNSFLSLRLFSSDNRDSAAENFRAWEGLTLSEELSREDQRSAAHKITR